MIGFSIEFKRWYFVLRGPKGRVYLATGFAKRMPVITPTGTYTIDESLSTIDDSFSAILADGWIDDVEDDEYED